MLRRVATAALVPLFVVLGAVPAWGCAGLIAPQGGIELLRTSTLAAYHDGIEHYVTSFEFSGKGGGRFGSIVPLPGIPTDVKKGGRWTLERLVLETQPPPPLPDAEFLSLSSAATDDADVLLTTRVEALKITVLEGGGDGVGRWAEEHGFVLPPDAPEMLDFYAERSPIFMAVRYDLAEARERDLESGDGTPVHITIPTPDPWVPLRILGLGKDPGEKVNADVFVLTDREPAMLPNPGPGTGMSLKVSEPASDTLLEDLRSDRGMGWLPARDMWLSYVRISSTAGELRHDLAIDATGQGTPSAVAAGLVDPTGGSVPAAEAAKWWAWALAAGMVLAALAFTNQGLRRMQA